MQYCNVIDSVSNQEVLRITFMKEAPFTSSPLSSRLLLVQSHYSFISVSIFIENSRIESEEEGEEEIGEKNVVVCFHVGKLYCT